METIEQKVNNVINRENSFEGTEIYKQFEQASTYYEDLVRRGIVTKRGYCLKTICDIPMFKYDKNIP